MKILVTGGAGFIGSALVRFLINIEHIEVITIDKLTYAGTLESLKQIERSDLHSFYQLDICNQNGVLEILHKHQPDSVMHLAAESHVDRSIDGPADFITTNIVGTYHLLEAVRSYYQELSNERKTSFRFHHISTDEVYGDLTQSNDYFVESTPYAPSSPYSASKASSDHLVRAWHRTFGLPIVVTNCSNNYGPYQFPEKLIPQTIIRAMQGQSIPVYGDGTQIRDWLFVEDHVRALFAVLKHGRIGETYNIGGYNEVTNIDVVTQICNILQETNIAVAQNLKLSSLIQFVTDRPGHDRRYAIDATKMSTDLGWKPEETFASGLRKTVHWYLNNKWWWES